MAFRHTTPEGRVYISHRPQVTAREAMVVSGHHYASQAGLRILGKGGNAIDAGVAAGICLSVLQTDMVSFLGVAPTMIYLAKEKRVLTISGLGRWPKAASIYWFEKNCGGEIPAGVRRAVTPAAADAWLTALECYGTKTFAEVAQTPFPWRTPVSPCTISCTTTSRRRKKTTIAGNRRGPSIFQKDISSPWAGGCGFPIWPRR